jgi:hypothetical protein
MNRLPTREELSRVLVMYGAFTSSGKIMDGNDQDTLDHLRRLRAKLDDERGEAVERVIRGLERIVAAEQQATA